MGREFSGLPECLALYSSNNDKDALLDGGYKYLVIQNILRVIGSTK